MKYERFEDLPVWKDAVELAVQIFALMEEEAFKGKGSLRDQIERAAVSISNNIAEGFERGTTQELITFIYIARGSAGEVRSMFHLFSRLPKFSNLKSQISNLRSLAESISRQLRAWADSLQNSDIKGQRYLNEQTRLEDQRKKEREGSLAEWRQMREDLTARLEAEQRQRETERKQSGEQT
ncbi:MAG: four helix bundle protein [Blastocatellia bacterium]